MLLKLANGEKKDIVYWIADRLIKAGQATKFEETISASPVKAEKTAPKKEVKKQPIKKQSKKPIKKK